jgi:hypothetical protein
MAIRTTPIVLLLGPDMSTSLCGHNAFTSTNRTQLSLHGGDTLNIASCREVTGSSRDGKLAVQTLAAKIAAKTSDSPNAVRA